MNYWLLAIGYWLFVSPVHAQHGADVIAKASGLDLYPSDVSIVAGDVIGTGLSLVGVLFFGLMIYGGLLWMTARGKEDQEKKALQVLTAAIIGLVIVFGAYAFTKFVLEQV